MTVFDNPSYDNAVIGVSHDGRVIYEYDLMICSLIHDSGMSEGEAIDFLEYNTIRAIPYAGPNAPIVMMPLCGAISDLIDTPESTQY